MAYLMSGSGGIMDRLIEQGVSRNQLSLRAIEFGREIDGSDCSKPEGDMTLMRYGALGILCMALLALAFGSSAFAMQGAVEAPVANDDDAPETLEPASEASSQSTSDSKDEGEEKKEEKKKGSPVSAYYDKGLHIRTEDDSFSARIRWRVQMRTTDINSPDLLGEEDGVEEEAGFLIRRARFKLDGHVYKDWLKYYLEYGIAGNILLTWEFNMDYNKKAAYRIGQYKVVYNRERVDSSGKQQFVDRSIVNSPFTVDRQQGMHLGGRLFKDTYADSHYWIGVFTGTGRGGSLEGDSDPMFVGRWQWNFLKRELPFSQSDVKRTAQTTGSFALGAATNQGQFTSWSSGGGGELPGIPDGVPGQYKTEQWMGEFALMRRGLSTQGEYHEKTVDDTINNMTTKLSGWYAQAGYFFHEVLDSFPEKLEFAVRFARVDTEQGVSIPADREATLAANYFFHGHNNKLTGDLSYLESQAIGSSPDDGWRVRLQWDISF
jgi:hypothetical protein